MVPAEREPGADDADRRADDEVEAMVAEVEEARGGDVDGGAQRHQREHEHPGRRRRGLVADGDDCWVAAFGVGVERGALVAVLAVEWKGE